MELSLFIIPGTYLVFVLISLREIWMSMKTFGRSSVGTLLAYFFVGTILLAGIRVLFFLVDTKTLVIDEMTLMVCWHVIFYMAVLTWLFAAHGMAALANIKAGKLSPIQAVVWGLISVAGMVYIFVHASLWDKAIVSGFEGTVWDHIGIMHFIAFVFAAGAAYYLFALKRRFSTSIGVIATPQLIVVVILSLIHLWELLGESWHLLPVSEAVGEQVEQILWIPVYAGIAYAFWKLRKKFTSPGAER